MLIFICFCIFHIWKTHYGLPYSSVRQSICLHVRFPQNIEPEPNLVGQIPKLWDSALLTLSQNHPSFLVSSNTYFIAPSSRVRFLSSTSLLFSLLAKMLCIAIKIGGYSEGKFFRPHSTFGVQFAKTHDAHSRGFFAEHSKCSKIVIRWTQILF